ncbi:1-deoxy-D-xylulose-5-phosphate reductoisomerase [Candidatus Pelagibacter sp.]|nr:1-deoxy-D-xylulose-5-phosphate reductoisomerase [Candidatus Pelagibacter sp.]
MKIKIAILGSTGSIGMNLLNILKKEKNFKILLLSGHKNYKKLLKQAKEFSVKNLIITDQNSFNILKSKTKQSNINIYNNFDEFNKIFKNRVDYVMSSITGIEGLKPTLKIIKHTKKIAIANKESIICGWGLIKKELKNNKTEFIPVDSEHFSLWFGLNKINKNIIEKIYLTASGGPFFKTPLKKLKNVSIKKALNHPNWKMGNKISIDSATLINKIYEVIEAKNIFNVPYNKIEILIHPNSYVHAIIKFKSGMIKIIAHETTMKIPIFNTLYSNSNKKLNTNKINIKSLNNLNLEKVDSNRFPMVKILNYLSNQHSLYDTVIVSANDALVNLYLKKQIKFTDIQDKLFLILKSKELLKFKKVYPSNLREIIELNKYVHLKVLEKVYKS